MPQATTALPLPPSICIAPTRGPAPDPTLESSKQVQAIIDHFSPPDFALSLDEHTAETRGLDEWEKMYLSRETMLRYLKACRYKLPETIKRLETSIVWRRTMGLDDVRGLGKELVPEYESGKVIMYGYSRLAQPVIYVTPSKNVRPPSLLQVKHMVYSIDRLVDLQLAGVDGVLFFADLSGKPPTSRAELGVMRQIISALQAHYPERCGSAALVKLPWLGSLLVTLLWPFVDADTKKKIHINPDMSVDLIPPEQLLVDYGGQVEFLYTPEYLPHLIDICVKRREENRQRWRAAGGTIGMSEWDFLMRVGESVSREL
ncbi:CRAL-TRIO domain-containing protein [Naematelia encephala]|uniref:CRAL-TRIO domain-containing protein n=1 Tax=Naematelia encephala TaxID=71784 RepID=A0A1Y2AU96_9TREE|nr:CRAL-TRIO domain-containing protein [Naematelia encephala]